MESRRVRLGDVTDDYCSRCRLLMNHGVVSIVGDEIKKVRCNTCMTEHTYRHGRLPAARRNATGKLFDEVLRGIAKPERPVPAAVPPRDETEGDASEVPAGEEAAALPGGEAAGPGPGDSAAAASSGAGEETPPGEGDANPSPNAGGPGAAPAPARMQRKLYTIRRAISDKSVDKGPKKS